MKSTGVRAFSVFGDISVIILNESDSNEVKLFSLFHEFCHLLKRQDGICSGNMETAKNDQPEERYCNEFAALVLMPDSELNKAIQVPITTLAQIEKFAKSFGVSKLATIIRLKELGIIDKPQNNVFKSNFKPLQTVTHSAMPHKPALLSKSLNIVLSNFKTTG